MGCLDVYASRSDANVLFDTILPHGGFPFPYCPQLHLEDVLFVAFCLKRREGECLTLVGGEMTFECVDLLVFGETECSRECERFIGLVVKCRVWLDMIATGEEGGQVKDGEQGFLGDDAALAISDECGMGDASCVDGPCGRCLWHLPGDW